MTFVSFILFVSEDLIIQLFMACENTCGRIYFICREVDFVVWLGGVYIWRLDGVYIWHIMASSHNHLKSLWKHYMITASNR